MISWIVSCTWLVSRMMMTFCDSMKSSPLSRALRSASRTVKCSAAVPVGGAEPPSMNSDSIFGTRTLFGRM